MVTGLGGATYLVVGNLQEFQHDGVRPHVPEQALLVFARLAVGASALHTQLHQARENLLDRPVVPGGTHVQRGPNVKVDGRLFIRKALRVHE